MAFEIPPHYLDTYGLLHKRNGERTGNGLSHWAWLVQAKSLVPGDYEDEWTGFCDAMRACGDLPLLNRAPDDVSLESHDDYVSILCAAPTTSTTVGFKIYNYGRQTRWSFNNVEPGKWTFESWLGRFPHFPVLAKLAATGTLNIFQRAILHATLLHGLHRAKQPGGSWIGPLTLSFACARALPGPFLSINRRIVKECREAHSDGLAGPFADYFLQDREHPVVKAWQAVEDMEKTK